MSINEFLTTLNIPGATEGAMLCLAIGFYGFWREWWVPGPRYRAERREKQWLQGVVWTSLRVADPQRGVQAPTPSFDFDERE